MKIFLGFLCVFMFQTSSLWAETIILQNGDIVNGTIIEQTDDEIKIDSGFGFVSTYYMDEIKEIKEGQKDHLTDLMGEVNAPDINSDLEDQTVPSELFVPKIDSENITQKKTSLSPDKIIKGADSQLEENNEIYVAEFEVMDGPVETYYENGQKWTSGTLKDGKLHGLFESYYEDGKLKMSMNYVDGILEGASTEYYESNGITLKRHLVEDEQKKLEVYNDERLLAEIDFVDEQISGEFKTFHLNGNNSSIATYKHWVRNGQEKYFDKNGDEIMSLLFDNGELKSINLTQKSYLK